ncbi:MAG: hypothetical protein GY847_39315, partial [Proteobacteria bacterium]|nr:hypothetical protein [Pseudomonadota bacterium]
SGREGTINNQSVIVEYAVIIHSIPFNPDKEGCGGILDKVLVKAERSGCAHDGEHGLIALAP